jgi:hypothetical protein
MFIARRLQGAGITGQDELHFQAPHPAQQSIDQCFLAIGLHNQAISQDTQIVAAQMGGSPPIQRPAQLRF